MFMDLYIPNTNFVKILKNFQFHFNWSKGMERFVDEKTRSTHASITICIIPNIYRLSFWALWRDHKIFFPKSLDPEICPK